MKSKMPFVYWLGWSLFRLMFAVLFRWRVFNPERVPLQGPVILASNHASFLDPPLVGSGLKRAINYLARESLFRAPGIGWLLRSWQAVPVDRDGGTGKGLKQILSRLEKGGGIILFPEGTRTVDGRLQPAKAGVGLSVMKSNAPVIPVRVFGTYEAFGKHRRFPHFNRVIVKYGKPLYFTELRAEAKTCSKDRLKQIYQQVSDQIMAEIAKLEPCKDVENFPA